MWLYLVALLGLYLLFRWYREQLTVPNLPDKYVLITGCDSGFGNLLARQLDKIGMQVLAACLTQKGAEQLKEATSQRLQTVILDVTNSENVATVAQWVKSKVGDKGLWGLVNNAGIALPAAPNEWLTKHGFRQVLEVNLLGVIDVTLSLTPLVRRASGRIVNVSSVAGRLSFIGGGYCISKYGLEAFSDSLRRELSAFGVKVAMIEPGFFKSPITDQTTLLNGFLRAWEQSSPEVQQSYGKQYFDVCQKNLKEMLQTCSSNLLLVTDCMQHGLTAQHPRTRYSAGWDAKLFYLPLSYCPTAWADFIFTLRAPKPAAQ